MSFKLSSAAKVAFTTLCGFGRAQRLGEHIVNARHLHHLAHRTPGDDPGAFRCGLQQNFRRAVTPAEPGGEWLVPFRFSLIKFFLACSMAFLMAMGTSRALPHTESRVAMMVAHHHQRGETKIFTALDYLRDAVDGDHVVLQVRRIYFQQPGAPINYLATMLRHKLEL